jgi:hypothetical protein
MVRPLDDAPLARVDAFIERTLRIRLSVSRASKSLLAPAN